MMLTYTGIMLIVSAAQAGGVKGVYLPRSLDADPLTVGVLGAYKARMDAVAGGAKLVSGDSTWVRWVAARAVADMQGVSVKEARGNYEADSIEAEAHRLISPRDGRKLMQMIEAERVDLEEPADSALVLRALGALGLRMNRLGTFKPEVEVGR